MFETAKEMRQINKIAPGVVSNGDRDCAVMKIGLLGHTGSPNSVFYGRDIKWGQVDHVLGY